MSKLTDTELAAIREYITGWEPTRDRRFLGAARALLDHSDALASENARLREALGAVAELGELPYVPQDGCTADGRIEAANIARRALDGEGGEGGA